MGRIMGKWKQGLGGSLKCRVEAEYMISQYEINVIKSSPNNCLIPVEAGKNGELTYRCNYKVTLAQYIEKGVDAKRLSVIVRQLVQLLCDLKHTTLDCRKLILAPEYIYVDKEKEQMKFLYYPVNGECCNYQVLLFIRDIVLLADLNGRERAEWEQWLKRLEQSDDFERALQELPRGDNAEKKSASEKKNAFGKGACDIDAEVETDAAEDIYEDDPETDQEGEETGSWKDASGNEWLQNDVEEAMTDVSEELFQDVIDQNDGTFVYDPFSERASVRPKSRARITRVKTGECVYLTKSVFHIGRSEQRADFCIRDNPKISSVHASILQRDDKFFFKDNFSTNGSYVDGKRVNPELSPIEITNGSIFTLWNEDFCFET